MCTSHDIVNESQCCGDRRQHPQRDRHGAEPRRAPQVRGEMTVSKAPKNGREWHEVTGVGATAQHTWKPAGMT